MTTFNTPTPLRETNEYDAWCLSRIIIDMPAEGNGGVELQIKKGKAYSAAANLETGTEAQTTYDWKRTETHRIYGPEMQSLLLERPSMSGVYAALMAEVEAYAREQNWLPNEATEES